MHLFEEAAAYTARVQAESTARAAGRRTVGIVITNGSKEPLLAEGKPHSAAGSHLSLSFQELGPQESGTVRVSANGDFAGAFAFRLGQDALYVGVSRSKGKTALGVQLLPPGSERGSLEQWFQSPGSLNSESRQTGKYAAFLRNVSDSPGRATVLLVETEDPIHGTGNFVMEDLEGLEQLRFTEELAQKRSPQLGDAVFLSELRAVMAGHSKGLHMHDISYSQDFLIDAFLARSGVLSSAHEVLAKNLAAWQKERPAPLRKAAAPLLYGEYRQLGNAMADLEGYVDAQQALLSSAVLLCARALHASGDRDSALSRVQAKLLVDDADLVDVPVAMPVKKGKCKCCKRKKPKADVDATNNFLCHTVKRCLHTGAEYEVRRSAVLQLLVELHSNDVRAALENYQRWLPLSNRRFSVTGAKGTKINFDVMCSELFVNLDDGRTANATLLLESLGFSSKQYKVLQTNSKSGEFFFLSDDKRFLVKTVSESEGVLLYNMLPAYQNHIRNLPRSLIVRYGSLIRMEVEGQFSMWFTVMLSVFDPSMKPDLRFDVKGSLFNRKAKAGEDVGKDEDWNSSGVRLRVHKDLRRELVAIHEMDANLLMSCDVMDYSLLIGVHRLEESERALVGDGWREGFGIWGVPGSDEVYFVGLIDFLIEYSFSKQGEHMWRVVQGHGEDASCVSPIDYAIRQVRFVQDCVLDEGPMEGSHGTLRVLVKSGHNLKNMDGMLGKSDPYVQVTLGLQKRQTSTIKDNHDPEWHEELLLPINEIHLEREIFVQVWDEDSVRALRGQDDPMGCLHVRLAEVPFTGHLELREQLLDIDQGELTLVISRIGPGQQFGEVSSTSLAHVPSIK